MLARTPYLTAQELGIREIEHEYLSRFVSEGEQGKLPEQHEFNMRGCYGEWECGTMGCIAGTMEMLARRDGRIKELTDSDSELYNYLGDVGTILHERVFYGDGHLARATLDQAVSCTKHFLQTGVVDWPLALGQILRDVENNMPVKERV